MLLFAVWWNRARALLVDLMNPFASAQKLVRLGADPGIRAVIVSASMACLCAQPPDQISGGADVPEQLASGWIFNAGLDSPQDTQYHEESSRVCHGVALHHRLIRQVSLNITLRPLAMA